MHHSAADSGRLSAAHRARVVGLAAVMAVAVVAVGLATSAVCVSAQADPLAREHEGIIADILYEQRHPEELPLWQQEHLRRQELLTNANTANVNPAMTELAARQQQQQTQAQGAGQRQLSAAEQKANAAAKAKLHAALHMQGGVATYTVAGHRSRNRHRNRHGHGHGQRLRGGQRWPEYEGPENEGASPEEAIEEAMKNANGGELSTDDVPELAQSFIGWFKYGKANSPMHKRMRGRLTYDYKLRKLQVDYFPGGLARRTYFFDYQKQVRTLYYFIGSVDPTRRSYKKAIERKKKREKAEEEAAEKGEELPPLARGSDALHQEDMLVLDNEDYTWKECTSWDLVEPYQRMCPTNCFSLLNDPSVASFPENSISDDGGTLDPYQEEKTVIIFLRGFIPGMKEGEDDAESGTEAIDHPPLWVRYAAMRNNTPTEIQLGENVWTFFRWVDLSEWDNFDLKDSGIIEALVKPDLNCIYAGAFTKDVEDIIQPFIPVVVSKRVDDGGGDDDD